MRNILLIGFALALGAACNGQTSEGLLPLPDDEAKKHEAPRADGKCRDVRGQLQSWVSALEAYDLGAREQFRLAEDPCGNSIATWGENRLDSRSDHGVTTNRLFRDGARDWRKSLYLGASERLSRAVDRFGNIVLLTEAWLQVLTPAGAPHLNMPLEGVGPGGLAIAESTTGWWLLGTPSRLISLPGDQTLSVGGNPDFLGTDRPSFLVLQGDRLLWSQVANGMKGDRTKFSETNLYVFEKAQEKTESLFSTSLTDLGLYAEAALLATDGERVFLGSTYYVADPMTLERIECSESVLIDIKDENWKPNPLGFCGAIEATVLVGGSLFSLWSVSVEPLDSEYHPFEAVPILMRHDLDGRETGRFELESIIGRTHQDGTGALDMAITDDGKAAIVGILNGGPWNGRFYLYPSTATVARVPLE